MRLHVIPLQKVVHFWYAILCWFDTFQPIRDKIFRMRKTTSKHLAKNFFRHPFNICRWKSFFPRLPLLLIISFQWGHINIPWHVHQSRHILTHSKTFWKTLEQLKFGVRSFFFNLSYWCVFNCFVNCFWDEIYDLKNECDLQRSI